MTNIGYGSPYDWKAGFLSHIEGMAEGHVWPYQTYGTPYAVYGERTYLMGGGVQMHGSHWAHAGSFRSGECVPDSTLFPQ